MRKLSKISLYINVRRRCSIRKKQQLSNPSSIPYSRPPNCELTDKIDHASWSAKDHRVVIVSPLFKFDVRSLRDEIRNRNVSVLSEVHETKRGTYLISVRWSCRESNVTIIYARFGYDVYGGGFWFEGVRLHNPMFELAVRTKRTLCFGRGRVTFNISI